MKKIYLCIDCNQPKSAKGVYCKKCSYNHKTRPSGLKYKIKVINKGWIKKGNKPWNSGKSTPYYDNNTGYYNIVIDGVKIKYHRYMMEQHLGRKLLPEEVVHHIDNDKLNNNINNLTVFDSKSEHLRHHWATTRRKD